MLSPHSFTILTICIYSLATIAGIGGMCGRRPAWRKAGCWLAIGAFFCQTVALIFGFHKYTLGGPSFGAYLQLLAWFLLLCGIAAWWRLRHDAIILFAAPFGLILFLMSLPSLQTGLSLPESLSAPFYALHIGALFLGLGLISLAGLAGIVFVLLEKRIKSKKNMRGFWEEMPALAILDKINFACSLLAFPLYTIGIISGLLYASSVFGDTFGADPKGLFSIFVWLLLAVLFHNRLAKGWKGRKPAMLAIAIFVLSLFSFLVVNFITGSRHSFTSN